MDLNKKIDALFSETRKDKGNFVDEVLIYHGENFSLSNDDFLSFYRVFFKMSAKYYNHTNAKVSVSILQSTKREGIESALVCMRTLKNIINDFNKLIQELVKIEIYVTNKVLGIKVVSENYLKNDQLILLNALCELNHREGIMIPTFVSNKDETILKIKVNTSEFEKIESFKTIVDEVSRNGFV